MSGVIKIKTGKVTKVITEVEEELSIEWTNIFSPEMKKLLKSLEGNSVAESKAGEELFKALNRMSILPFFVWRGLGRKFQHCQPISDD